MAMNFNTAGEQRSIDLIKADTIATVHLTVRPGNAGDGGWLKRTKAGDAMMLDCEFVVTEGEFAKRKFWGAFITEGTTDGHQTAAEITASRIRAILESAHGIRPDDETDAAKNLRCINSWADLNNLRFVAKIGIEKGKEGYKDKNVLSEVITPDRKQWARIDQVAKPTGSFAPIGQAAAAVAAKAAPTAGKPAWASN